MEFVCTKFVSQKQRQAKEIGFMISQQTLQKFKEIFEREIGPMPDEKVLLDSACDLLTLFDNTYKPIKKEWVEKFTPRQKEMVENGQFIVPGAKNKPRKPRK